MLKEIDKKYKFENKYFESPELLKKKKLLKKLLSRIRQNFSLVLQEKKFAGYHVLIAMVSQQFILRRDRVMRDWFKF